MARDRALLDKSFTGRLGLSIAAARAQRDAGQGGNEHSFARLVLANFISRDLREATFARGAERDRTTFGQMVREDLGRDPLDLSARQGVERAEVRNAWYEIYRDKGRG